MRSYPRLSWLVTLLVVASLLAGCITINPSGLTQSVLTPAAPSATSATFTADLIAALVNRDFAQLQSMMGSPFVLALWQSDGQAITPETGIQRLQDVFVAGASLTFVAPVVVDQWLSGVDPLALWPVEANPVSALGISGLGVDGNAQAILMIAEYPDGGFYWYSLLLAPSGFATAGGSPPTAIVIVNPGQTQPDMLPTDVQRVLVLGVVGIFTGPGAQFPQIGTTTRGQTFPVIGVSPDGQWWAVVCPATTATCWISANPTFVRPMGPSGPTPVTPVPTAYPTAVRPTPTPFPTQIPPDYPTRIPWSPGQDTAVVSGQARSGWSPQFLFYAAAGQRVRLLLSSPGGVANFSLRGVSDGQWYKTINNPSREWSATLPRTQDYLITVAAPVNANFTLEVTLFGLRPPTVTPAPAPERIRFATGESTAVRSGVLYGGTAKQYVFGAQAGQIATLLLTGPPGSRANFSVRGVSDGVLYKSASDPARESTFYLPRTQDYLITISAPGETAYTLELTIPPLGPTPFPPTPFPPTPFPPTPFPPTVVPPTPHPIAPERIGFPPGGETAVRSGPLAAGQVKQYVFFGMAGQVATIQLNSPSPAANFTVVGVDDGIPYKSQGSSAWDFTFTLPLGQDYLISIFAPVNTSYTLVLTIPPIGPMPTVEPLPTVGPPTVEPLPTVGPPTVEPLPTVGPLTPEPLPPDGVVTSEPPPGP